MIRAVIFDLDGVLADSEPLWIRMMDIYFEKKGITVPKNFADLSTRYMKGRDIRQVTRFIKRFFKIKDSVAGIHRERMKIVLNLFRRYLRPTPYAVESVKALAKIYPVALASSSPRSVVEVELARIKIKRFFTRIVAGDEVRIAKPHPDIYLRTAKKLGVKPSECVVVEDSLAGVKAAKRAGMVCVLLKTSYTLPAQRRLADSTISSLRELSRRIEQLSFSG